MWICEIYTTMGRPKLLVFYPTTPSLRNYVFDAHLIHTAYVNPKVVGSNPT